ncbi:MAG TPA: prolyl oligopeptidase family serine peptidase [Kofleriaceae bacterium]
MRTLCVLVVAACGSQAGTAPVASPPAVPAPAWPASRVATVVDTVQGVRVADPYRWLEDEHAPEVQAWMTAQDRYARAELARSPHRAELASRLAQLSYYDSVGGPIVRGRRQFYERKHADKEKLVVYWRDGDAGEEHVLFDPNTWSADGSTGLHGWQPSWDGKTVAYGVSEHNADEAVLHVLDVEAGAPRPDVIDGARFAYASWTPDSRGFYYTWEPPVGGPITTADRQGFAEVRYHQLGTPPAADPIIYPATHDPQGVIEAGVSRDGHWLTTQITHGSTSADWYIKDLRAPAGAWTTLVAGADAEFDVTAWRDQFYVTTNQAAPRGRVYRVDPQHLDRASWREIIPQRDTAIEGIFIVGDRLLIDYVRDAASELELHALDGTLIAKLALPIGSVRGVAGEPDQDTAYVSFTSFTQPKMTYKLSLARGELVEYARPKLALDTSQLTTERVMYTSKDGTKVPLVILAKKGAPRDGTNPTILTGYGGFDFSYPPYFDPEVIAWLERGGVWAVANLRGGGEYGEDWHRAGMLDKKQNVFDDFIAAAEYLIAERWTARAHLAITGASNGGLLVGAAATQRPELFKAVQCGVPLLDMLRYHRFGLGQLWVSEYGSADDAAQFKALYAYSPYRVAVDAGKRDYPTILFDSADHDDRVDPLHARKLAALLQASQTGDGKILLRIERNSGHGGADVVKQNIERGADALGLFDRLLR